jgi:hypothetical protein
MIPTAIKKKILSSERFYKYIDPYGQPELSIESIDPMADPDKFKIKKEVLYKTNKNRTVLEKYIIPQRYKEKFFQFISGDNFIKFKNVYWDMQTNKFFYGKDFWIIRVGGLNLLVSPYFLEGGDEHFGCWWVNRTKEEKNKGGGFCYFPQKRVKNFIKNNPY